MVLWLRLWAPNAGGMNLIPGLGTRSHKPQLRVCLPQLQILHAEIKTRPSQINIFFFLKRKRREVLNYYLLALIFIAMWYSVAASCCSLAQLCLTLCNPMDCSMTGFRVHHQLPELAQTHVHQVSDVIQPSHPLSSPPPIFNVSHDQGPFQWVSSSYQVAKVWELQFQHQFFQCVFRTDFL